MVQDINRFNEKFGKVINNVVKKKLGVVVNMQCVNKKYGFLEDTIKTDVDKKMRGNKILRQLFRNITLDGYAYEDSESGEVQVRLHVHYSHTCGGGSNGHEVLGFYIDKDAKKVKYFDY